MIRKIICLFFSLLTISSFTTSVWCYDEDDIKEAQRLARVYVSSTSQSHTESDGQVYSGEQEYKQYYIDTLNRLKKILKMGFDTYTTKHHHECVWEIKSIPVLKKYTLVSKNFNLAIKDAISLFEYLLKND